VAEAIIDEWPDADLHGLRILLPRAAEARDLLPVKLRERGAEVEVVTAYETVVTSGDTEELRAQLLAGEIDAVTFTASSTARNFALALGIVDPAAARRVLCGARVIAIGPITAATAAELGMTADVIASEHTIRGLVAAIESALSGPTGGD
jgi:uroporphyrinogen III methyltransferase/synthase